MFFNTSFFITNSKTLLITCLFERFYENELRQKNVVGVCFLDRL